MNSLCASVGFGLWVACATVVALESQVTGAVETTTTTTPSTTENVQTECAALNSSCGVCITKASCMWCGSKSACLAYPGGIPSSDFCSFSDLRWGTCWVNFEALLIAVSIIAGLLIISLIICICCFYRRCHQRCAARRERQEEEINNAEFQERRARNDARRAERRVKYDDIRRKYGLSTDGGSSSSMPYSRFDNEA